LIRIQRYFSIKDVLNIHKRNAKLPKTKKDVALETLGASGAALTAYGAASSISDNKKNKDLRTELENDGWDLKDLPPEILIQIMGG